MLIAINTTHFSKNCGFDCIIYSLSTNLIEEIVLILVRLMEFLNLFARPTQRLLFFKFLIIVNHQIVRNKNKLCWSELLGDFLTE